MKFRILSTSLLVFIFLNSTGWGQHARATESALQKIDTIVRAGIAAEKMPGAVIAFADANHTLFLKAFGNRVVRPTAEPMTIDTVFDLASLTKPLATATSIMILQQRGMLSVDDRVATYLPEFGTRGKQVITIADCLLHRSGLIADNALADYEDGPEAAWQNICQLSPQSSPGTKFQYSDVGFLVLGKLVQGLSGQPLDEFATQNIYRPLGMEETRFKPPADWQSRIAPNDQPNQRALVHDPRARRMGGVAGHAGLFSTTRDLIRFGQAMLRCDAGQDGILARPTLEQMIRPISVPRRPNQRPAIRGLGWDIQSPYSSNRGSRLSTRAFGHGGFTGTVIWIDPVEELVFVFLSNRLHPSGSGQVNRLAGEIIDVAIELELNKSSIQRPGPTE